MKIVTPEQFEVEQKENLLYVGRIRAADYIWVHRSGADNSLVHLEYIAKDLQGDILVPQKTNNDDWSWANYHLSGRVGMDDTIFVAAGDLYRDSTMQRKAQYISNELLEQIEPHLKDLGALCADKFVGSSYDKHGAESKLLEEANKKGADYVVLESSYCQGFGRFYADQSIQSIYADHDDDLFAISRGKMFKLKRAKNDDGIKMNSPPQTTPPESSAHDSIALDYAKRLLAGNVGRTVMDWKKQ